MNLFLSIFVCFWISNWTGGLPSTDELFSLSLQNIDGKDFSMSDLKNNKGSVIVYLLPDCPACQSYSLTLNKISRQYEKEGIRVYGIFPGTYNTGAEMKTFQKVYKIRFPLLIDPDKRSVRALKARVAPEVFLLNSRSEILYRGRIDDWMVSLGKKRTVILHHDLEDALTAFRSGQLLHVRETTPVGCIIE